MTGVRVLGPVVLLKWTHTQQSRIVRPDRYRQSGTDNPDASVDERKWRALDGTDREVLVELNREYHRWFSAEECAVAINSDDEGVCRLNEAAVREEISKISVSFDLLWRLELVRRRGKRYRAIIVSDGFDVGRVVAVGELNLAGVEPSEFVLFDSGTAISIGWPATKEEEQLGLDGTQAGWAGHVLAWLLGDPRDPAPDDLPGSEVCRNWYHFVPADRVAASIGFDPPAPGEIG